MTKINVKGVQWDVQSVTDGNVIFADGDTTMVNENTQKIIEVALKAATKSVARKSRKKKA